MDLSFRLTRSDAEALRDAVALWRGRDGAWLTAAFVGLAGAATALAGPGDPWVRLLLALVAGAAGGALAWGAAQAWRRARLAAFPAPDVIGLEPGERTLTLTLPTLHEDGPLGERGMGWGAVLGAVRANGWRALVVSDREAVAVPPDLLSDPRLAEGGALRALLGR